MEQFQALPRERITVDIHCVTKWSKFDTTWTAVAEREHVLGGRLDAFQSVSIETPVHVVSNFDHFVTQWMSTVMRSRGSAWNCSHVQEIGSSTAPRISNVHASSG